MPILARVLMGGIAVFIAWTMVRGFRTGQIFSQEYSFSADDQPTMFALGMFTRSLMIFFCLWLAAGYDVDGFLQLFGLEWLAIPGNDSQATAWPVSPP